MKLSHNIIYLLCLSLYAFVPWTSYGSPLEIYVLNIGQGDSILIQTPSNHRILIDAGPDQTVLDQLDQVVPFWDRRIDAIVPTHPQADHVTGFLDVMQHFHVDQAFITAARSQSSLSTALDKEMLQQHVKQTHFYQGQKTNFNDGVTLQSLWPPANTNWNTVADLNDVAQVDELQYKYFSALFTSDAGANIDKKLPSNHHITLLKVPHHGSKTGMDTSYLSELDPLISVISVGAHNPYGHPTAQALAQLNGVHSKIYRTDRDGRVEVGVDGAGFWIKESGVTYNK